MMRDGRTKKLTTPRKKEGPEEYLSRHRVTLVIVSGSAFGDQHEIGGERTVLGRGPGVDLAFDNPAMSRQHAVIEYTDRGFRIRDLGSTNGILFDGSAAQAADLESGGRFSIGDQTFELVIEAREEEPTVYELSSEA